jgi:predicted nucleotidyltransferase
MLFDKLYKDKLTNFGGNSWLPKNTHYISIMGSTAYGVSGDTSDVDIYSFCIPPIEHVFPHTTGELYGFGDSKSGYSRFRQFQEHHIIDKNSDKQYDLNVYNIVDYFQLVMENNPNMLDSLFVPNRCIIHATHIGQMVREKRKMFLHLGCWHTFKGYSFAQIKKAKSVNRTGKRKEIVEELGYCPKFLYHVVRLLLECEQILTEGDIDLERNSEHLKAIRRGDIGLEEVEKWFQEKELLLEKKYSENKLGLPWGPKDQNLQNKVKQLLLECLEQHYGSLDKLITNPDKEWLALKEIKDIILKYNL